MQTLSDTCEILSTVWEEIRSNREQGPVRMAYPGRRARIAERISKGSMLVLLAIASSVMGIPLHLADASHGTTGTVPGGSRAAISTRGWSRLCSGPGPPSDRRLDGRQGHWHREHSSGFAGQSHNLQSRRCAENSWWSDVAR